MRLTAVAADHDPELLAALPEIARSDPDARVRLAALKRLDDYEPGANVPPATAMAIPPHCAGTYIALLCSDAACNPTLRRRISELDTLSTAEIEKVAT